MNRIAKCHRSWWICLHTLNTPRTHTLKLTNSLNSLSQYVHAHMHLLKLQVQMTSPRAFIPKHNTPSHFTTITQTTLLLQNYYKRILKKQNKQLTLTLSFDFDFALVFTLSIILWSRIQSDFASNNLPLWIRDHEKN